MIKQIYINSLRFASMEGILENDVILDAQKDKLKQFIGKDNENLNGLKEFFIDNLVDIDLDHIYRILGDKPRFLKAKEQYTEGDDKYDHLDNVLLDLIEGDDFMLLIYRLYLPDKFRKELDDYMERMNNEDID